MKRRKVTLQEVRDAVGESDINLGICALVDVENMGGVKTEQQDGMRLTLTVSLAYI